MTIGARVLKTGMAVALAVYLSSLLGFPITNYRGGCCDFHDTAIFIPFLAAGNGRAPNKFPR